jgi:LuxR family transcriptional regulator, maltose regulon positive regulatory protein
MAGAVSLGVPILTAKITAPAVPDWAVQRPRITKLIAEGTRWCPLTVVTGPAGAGKTTALALWAAAEPGPVAWVTLDEFDSQPGTFWSYVVAALRRSGVAVSRTPPPARRGRAADHAFLLRLASALATQNPAMTLVLDDLHLLSDPKALGELDYVLRNTGPGMRLAVSSRMDPPLPLHRYRLAGQLAEIRAGDLAFSIAEAGLVLDQHGITLPSGSLECLTRRTEGWAACIRLAALSMGTHPDPDQFVKELATEDNAVTGYLVEEVLNAQPPQARELLLSTSILEQVSTEAASELTGHEQAGRILADLARSNTFVQPIGGGRYRYHTLFAEVLRLKLRDEYPGRIASLHRRAALWYERNGPLTDAVRHAAEARDWPFAARMVIDGLAIGEIMQPRGSQSLAGRFRDMPHGQPWAEPQPHLVLAAVALSAGRPASSAAALDAAEGILGRLPADQEAASRLAAAMIGLAAARGTGNFPAAAAAAERAEMLADAVARDKLARHPEIRARVLAGRGTVELWTGHLDDAARILESAVAAAAAAGEEDERADCLGHLALAEALRGRLDRAAQLAARAIAAVAPGEQLPPAGSPSPAALVALAWVHLEHNELREARGWLTQSDTALALTPDRLIGAMTCLAAACVALAEGRAEAASHIVARARSGWSVPAWLQPKLSLVESLACAATGDIRPALAAAEQADGDNSPEASVALAHAWAVAGDGANARRALEAALGARNEAPERVRLQAWLVDARISYHSGDRARGRRSLASALRLAEREQLRLPLVLEHGWLGPVLKCDPELAGVHRRLLGLARRHDRLPAPPAVPEQAAILMVEQLTEREREVLRHFSGMLNAAEVASELYISVNTVKTHLRNIYRKLGVAHCRQAVRRARELELI